MPRFNRSAVCSLISVALFCTLLHTMDVVSIRKSLGLSKRAEQKTPGRGKKVRTAFAFTDNIGILDGLLKQPNIGIDPLPAANDDDDESELDKSNVPSSHRTTGTDAAPIPIESLNSSTVSPKNLAPHPTEKKLPTHNMSHSSLDRVSTKSAVTKAKATVNAVNHSKPQHPVKPPTTKPPQPIPSSKAQSKKATPARTNRPTAATPITSCRRICQHYDNKILLPRPPSRAGLSDRMTVIGGTLNLAGYLCARVYISRPIFWLHPGHNGRKDVDLEVTWDDFQLYRFADEVDSNRSALLDWVNSRYRYLPPLPHTIKRSRRYHKWLYLRSGIDYFIRHFERLESFSFLQQQRQQTNQSSKVSLPQQRQPPPGFIWDIRADFYHWLKLVATHLFQREHPMMPPDLWWRNSSVALWRKDMLPFGPKAPLFKGCRYAVGQTPKAMQIHLDKIFEHVRQNVTKRSAIKASSDPMPPSELHSNQSNDTMTLNSALQQSPWLIGYFHVRRGDTVNQCNTTLERLERYINCSLTEPLRIASSQSNGGRHQVIILFSSDEEDVKYRRKVARLVKKHNHIPRPPKSRPNITVSFVDLDQLGRDLIAKSIERRELPEWQRHNNFFLYRIISHIEWGRREINFRLDQRRTNCPDCTNLTRFFLSKLED